MSRPELCAECDALEADPDAALCCGEHVLDCRRLQAVYDDGVKAERQRCAKLAGAYVQKVEPVGEHEYAGNLDELYTLVERIRSGEQP